MLRANCFALDRSQSHLIDRLATVYQHPAFVYSPSSRRLKKQRHRLVHALFAVLVVVFSSAFASASAQSGSTTLSAHAIESFGAPPEVPSGALDEGLVAALQAAFVMSLERSVWGAEQQEAMVAIAESGDPRVAWIVADMMRFASHSGLNKDLSDAASVLLDITFDDGNSWGKTTDHLIAWDIPAPPGYLAYKRGIFTSFVPGWESIFVEGDIDWRHVSWGGVLIDDRAFDTTDEACNCIPGADNPEVIAAADANWLDDDDIVFGIEINGEARAYPRQIMEVREMINDTLGGRDLGIPYCTLCGSAQAWFTDELPEGIERPVLRTSGLLIRSNKVMYDITSQSVFDTFRGNAVTGPLAEAGFKMSQASVVTTEWGQWKAAYPETTVLVEALALGRDFDFRNGRDSEGPIFPVGDVDPRLTVHEDIVGVIDGSGNAIAFQRSNAMSTLLKGDVVESQGVRLMLDGGGIRAVNGEGADLGSHESFWFAWSQFYPQTSLWPM